MPEQLQDELVTQLPHNLDAERALLGALLLDPQQIDLVLTLLPGESVHQALNETKLRRGDSPREPLFFSAAHQAIFGAICRLHYQRGGADMTTLAEELQSRGELELVGGSSYLATLVDELYSLHQVPEYARIIEHKWRLRNLIKTSHAIASEALRTRTWAPTVLEDAERRIHEIAHAHSQTDFTLLGDAVEAELAEIDEMMQGRGAIGLRTGFGYLDEFTSGLRPGNMIVLAARPGVGKSAFAMNIAANIAIRQNKPVAFFSLEMSVAELTTRLLCGESQISMQKVRGGKLRREEQDRLHEAGARMKLSPLHIDDTSGITALELRARARRLHSRAPELALIIVDYLQLLTGGGARYDNRQQEVSEISRSIKVLAKELGVPIIALSQMSRLTEQRSGKEKVPKLSDLRESGAIEQDADMVWFIHRDRPALKDGEEHPPVEEVKLIIGKQRNGRRGSIDMLFRGEYTEFTEAARGH